MVNWSKSLKHLLVTKYLRTNRLAKNSGRWCQLSLKTQRYLLFTPETGLAIQTNHLRLKPLCSSSKIASAAKKDSYLYYSQYQRLK